VNTNPLGGEISSRCSTVPSVNMALILATTTGWVGEGVLLMGWGGCAIGWGACEGARVRI